MGIKRAKGLYITFIDSDDAIGENTLQQLMEELYQHPDVDILEYPIMERIGHPHRESSSPSLRNLSECHRILVGGKGLSSYVCLQQDIQAFAVSEHRISERKSFEDVWTIPKLIGLTETEITQDRAVVSPPPLK